jgi:hypothetical protein
VDAPRIEWLPAGLSGGVVVSTVKMIALRGRNTYLRSADARDAPGVRQEKPVAVSDAKVQVGKALAALAQAESLSAAGEHEAGTARAPTGEQVHAVEARGPL